jgi:hypothetical protein
MAEITSIKSSELLKNCYGTERQQKKGSCWFDSTLEIMLNADLIGEIVRSDVFDYGLHKGKVVPYRVKPEIINRIDGPRIDSFILYFILNYILFNLEITNQDDYLNFSDISGNKKVVIERKEELDVCERNLENFLAKTRKILFALKLGIAPKMSLSKKLTEDSYGGAQLLIYELFINNIRELNRFINVNTYYGKITTSKKEAERRRKFPETEILFNRNNFLAASLTFNEHATSVIRCQNTIFYYDNNAPIDLLTKKRNIDFSIQKDEASGTVVKRKDFLEKFWNHGLDYLKHWGDYFDRYKRDGYNFRYIQKVSKDSNEFYHDVTIFDKKPGVPTYNKEIPLIKLDDSINLKDIISCEFFKSKSNIISLFSSDDKIVKFVNECYIMFVSEMHISNKYLSEETNQELKFYEKYKKYKVKYLNLLTKINSKKLIL